jgi:hypothetical protein
VQQAFISLFVHGYPFQNHGENDHLSMLIRFSRENHIAVGINISADFGGPIDLTVYQKRNELSR